MTFPPLYIGARSTSEVLYQAASWRALEAPCRDCGHLDHAPGSCNAFRFPFSGVMEGQCSCEIHDDERDELVCSLRRPAPPSKKVGAP